MIDLPGFHALVDHLIAKGFDEETAASFVASIGDTPEIDDSGHVIVRDHAGQIVARLKDYPLGRVE